VKRGATIGTTALLGGAVGLALAALLLGPSAAAGLVPARGDLADFFWPMKAYTAARWGSSGLPLWNPLSGCGEPWLAQLQTGVLNPGDLPFLLGRHAGPLAALTLHLAIAAAGTAGWLASLGTSRAAALAGAAVFAGSGAFLSLALVYNNFATAAFLPWLFLGARRAARGASPAGFALAVALSFLAGEPALALAGALAAAAVALATRTEEPGAGRAPSAARAGARVGLSLVLGFGLAAATLLPFVSLAASSRRLTGATKAEALARPVGASDLADLVLPPEGDETRRASPGRGGYLATLALAPLPFVLAAAAGAGFAARPRLLACLAALALLGLLLALGARGLLMPLLWETGIARGVRFPARWFVFTQLALAAAAGAGLDGWREGHLLRWPKRSTHEGEPPDKAALVASAVVASAALVALLLLAAKSGRTLGVASLAALAAVVAGILLLAILRISPFLPPRLAGALLVALVFLPLPLASRDLFAGVPAAELSRVPAIVSDLPSGPPGRFFSVASDGALLRTWLSPAGAGWTTDTPVRARDVLAGYTSLSIGLSSASSPSPIGNPARTHLLGAALLGGDAATLLGLLDVTRVVTPFASTMPGTRLERRAGPVLRYTLARPVGRVFFAREASEATDDTVLAALVAPGFDPEERAYLARGDGAIPPRRAAKGFAVAKITRDEPEVLEVETATSEAATLVVTRSWDAGWEARLDGEKTPLRRCDLALLAVAVPAGDHRFVLAYRPASFRIGAGASLAAGLVLVGLLLAGGREPGA
jgi:hypothetical protein